MIILHVKYSVKPGKRDEFVAAAKDVIAGTTAEAGNKQYEYSLPKGEADTVRLIELWDDEAALELHFNTAHMAAFSDVKAKFVDDVEIRKFEANEVPFKK
jgi:quinol monooxygenase YgiN